MSSDQKRARSLFVAAALLAVGLVGAAMMSGFRAVAPTVAPVQAQDRSSDQARLEAVLEELDRGGDVRVEELESIPSAAESPELQYVLGDLVRAREELNALRDRYEDDYPPIQELLSTIDRIETDTIPTILRGLIAEGAPRGDA